MAHLAPGLFTLRQLQYAVAVADELSFRAAADECHVSQPALSTQLAQLEGALGVRLFERDRRRVLVTAGGRELVERARRVLLEAEDLLAAAKRFGDPLAGTLRIGVIPTISPYLLPHAAPALRAKFERLAIVWVEEKTDVLVRRLDAGELDAALVALEAELGDVESEVVAEDPFVLVAPKGHPLAARRSPARLDELRGESVLLLDDGHCFREQALAVCSNARAEELEFRATSLSTLVQMVASGMGVTLLPELALAAEIRGTDLRARRFVRPAPHRTLALVWRKRSPLGEVFRALAREVRAAVPDAPRVPDPPPTS
jgi:LysR family transcriptional regulator, hydrogen peroxide-inducible genes activator